MNKLTQALMEELTVEYVKVGSLQIPESVVISWVIMLLLVVGSILLTRNLKVDHISKRQAALEALYSLGKNFFEGLLGKEGSRYVPYLMTVALYIACSNVIGVFGVKPPTKDLDVTAALALMSIVLIEYPERAGSAPEDDRGRYCSGKDLQDRGRRSTYDRAGQAA